MKYTYSKQSISEELAQKLIDAATKKAREIGQPMSIAILDEGGGLKAFKRMDGASLLSVEISQIKAYTAAGNKTGSPTHELYNNIKDNPALVIGLPHLPKYTIVGGGFAIRIDGQIIGGIGISGGTAEQDIVVAEAALNILNN
jgi:uncharacterized protein GlcG (DUF336 family)